MKSRKEFDREGTSLVKKGAASPSSAGRFGDWLGDFPKALPQGREAPLRDRDYQDENGNEDEDSLGANLSGLIRRRGAVQYNPDQPPADHVEAAAALRQHGKLDRYQQQLRQEDARPRPAPAPRPATAPAPAPRSATAPAPTGFAPPLGPRRQLTVRVSMSVFTRLQQLCKRTGQNFQDVESAAITGYLDRMEADERGDAY